MNHLANDHLTVHTFIYWKAKYISARILRALKNSYLSKLLLLKPIVNATISRNFCLSNKCGAFFSLKTISRNFFIQFPRRTDDGFEIVDFTIKLCPASDLFRQIVLRYIQLAKFSQNFSPAFFFFLSNCYTTQTQSFATSLSSSSSEGFWSFLYSII